MATSEFDQMADLLARNHMAAELLSSVDKYAITDETQRFIEWAMMKRDQVRPSQIWKFLERNGVPLVEAKGTKRGQPLEEGEMVRVDTRKVPGHLQDILGDRDGDVGTVTDVQGRDVLVLFERERVPIRIDGGAAGPKVGLYRHTPASAALSGGRKAHDFEVVYVADKNASPPSPDNVKMVQDYIERGYQRGEKRSRVYYTGLILSMNETKGKTGPQIFKIFAQQRDHFPRTINPSKGEVFYIGRLNQRPPGWEREYEKMIAAAPPEED